MFCDPFNDSIAKGVFISQEAIVYVDKNVWKSLIHDFWPKLYAAI